MIKNTCTNCGNSMESLKAIFATKCFAPTCNNCGTKLFRKHYCSTTLLYLLGSIGVFILLFSFMNNGLRVTLIGLASYLLLTLIAYVGELFIFGLSEYTDHDEKKANLRTRRSVLIAAVIIFIGAILYFFDL